MEGKGGFPTKISLSTKRQYS